MTTRDLDSRDAIVELVDAFCAHVRADDLLGPIFDDVAQVDWAAHLPRMYAFWDSVLFGTPGFKGNPLAVHLQLGRRARLTAREFERWLELFNGSVDALFAGPGAEAAKARAARIATVMLHHLDAQRRPGAGGAGLRLDPVAG
jgi:hemoglobin